jgi:hypothetical protein
MASRSSHLRRRSRCDIRTRACTSNSTPRPAVAFWRKRDTLSLSRWATELGAIIIHVQTTFRETLRFDQAGNLVTYIRTESEVTSSLTFSANGVTLSSAPTGPLIINFAPDEIITTVETSGIGLKVTVLGQDEVLLDTGHRVFDTDGNEVFGSGPTVSDTTRFCAALT